MSETVKVEEDKIEEAHSPSVQPSSENALAPEDGTRVKVESPYEANSTSQQQQSGESAVATREEEAGPPRPFASTDANDRAPAVPSSGPPVHDESQMDHPRGPLNEKLKFFLANLPPSVTALEMRRHFEAYGNVNYVKLIYNKATGVSMGYGFLYLMDEDTDRRVEEYSVRNNYRIRFANFSRIYLQRNDKTRTRPLRFKAAHENGTRFGADRHGRNGGNHRPRHDDMGHYGPRDRSSYPPNMNGGRGFRRGEAREHHPGRQHVHPNESRVLRGSPPARGLRQAMPPGGPPPCPPEFGAHRDQPQAHAQQGYQYGTSSSNHESGYYEQQQMQAPTSGEYYEGHQQHAVAHGHTGGYEDYQGSYEGAAVYHQGYSEQGYGQHQHQGYGDQEQGYANDGGQFGYYESGQYNEEGVYQQGEYYDGNHSNETYGYSQQQGEANQSTHHGYSQNQPYSAESAYQGSNENAGYAYQGDYSDAGYSYAQDGSHLQSYGEPNLPGQGSYQQNSRNYDGGAGRGYSQGGGRGRGGRGTNGQRFQCRDRPY